MCRRFWEIGNNVNHCLSCTVKEKKSHVNLTLINFNPFVKHEMNMFFAEGLLTETHLKFSFVSRGFPALWWIIFCCPQTGTVQLITGPKQKLTFHHLLLHYWLMQTRIASAVRDTVWLWPWMQTLFWCP